MKPRTPGLCLDPSSIETLYQRYAPMLLVYLHRRTSSWEDAEDLLLEVFVAALEREQMQALPEGEQFAWLQGVAEHKLIDFYRRSARRPTIPLDGVVEALESDERLAPEQVALRHEAQTQLQAALQQLPTLHQEVVRLRFVHGLRCAEIATLLGKREGTVRVLLLRAVRLLRTRYEEQ